MSDIIQLTKKLDNLQLEMSPNECRKKILDLFRKNVSGKQYSDFSNHCGSEGHFLEKLMGIQANSKNEPDIHGYEMKKYSSKITFGDWSAEEYIFKPGTLLASQQIKISRPEFIKTFGTQNPKKHNRYSWSGTCIPSYNVWNDYGQIMTTDSRNNLYIVYKSQFDKYLDSKPEWCKEIQDCILAYWSHEKIKKHVENKFCNNGFFVCKKNNDGVYDRIAFGKKINFDVWIENLKNGTIFFDSGMYNGNKRNYSIFRAKKHFWDSLILEECS